jgi:hypothetical protein
VLQGSTQHGSDFCIAEPFDGAQNKYVALVGG